MGRLVLSAQHCLLLGVGGDFSGPHEVTCRLAGSRQHGRATRSRSHDLAQGMQASAQGPGLALIMGDTWNSEQGRTLERRRAEPWVPGFACGWRPTR